MNFEVSGQDYSVRSPMGEIEGNMEEHGGQHVAEHIRDEGESVGRTNNKVTSKVRKGYYEWYLNEASQFFDPFACNKDFRKSSIHKNSRCIYLQRIDQSQSFSARYSSEEESSDDNSSDEDEKPGRTRTENYELGSIWNRKEKQLFFHHLSRHSIHSLDSWCERIPTKSKLEILMYHDVLKENLKLLKNLNTRKHGGILTYKHLPIAYEMNEEWIALEEELSSEPIQDNSTADLEQPPEDGLISWENWYKRWSPVYSRHRLMEYYPSSRQPNIFGKDAKQLLERLAKSYTCKLLREVIIPVLDKKSVPKSSLQNYKILKTSRLRKLRSNCSTLDISDNKDIAIATSNAEFPHVITEQEVINALIRLRLYRRHKHCLTYPESIVESINKFNLNVQDGKLFKNKNIIKHLQVPLLLNNANIYASPLKKTLQFDQDHSKDSTDNYEPSSSKQALEMQLDGAIDHDDMERSAKYGHILVTWLSISRDARQSRDIFRVSLSGGP